MAAEAAVHLVTQDQVLAERLKLYMRRHPGLRLTVSENVPPRVSCDALVLPADIFLLPKGKYKQYSCPCIVYGGARSLRTSFLAGCSDYLREPWAPEELECRVYRVLEQRLRQREFFLGKLVVEDNKIITGNGEAALSYPERLLLEMFLYNPGQVVPREVLSYTLWGKQPPPGSRALDVHVSALRRKLTSLCPGCRISSCRGVGYRLAGAVDTPRAG